MLNNIKQLIKYYYLKIKWRKKVLFTFNNTISMRSYFEGMNKLYPYTTFDGYMGIGSYIASNSNISGKIGRYTSIASNCKVIIGSHPYTYPYVSTSPIFFSMNKQNGYTFAEEQEYNEYKYADKKFLVNIGSDCWIGESVSLISGITIGDGAVILAGAIVTKDIPPYAIAGGIPAKILKYRYDENDIKLLLKFKWWNKETTWIKKNAKLFLNMNLFKSYIKGHE